MAGEFFELLVHPENEPFEQDVYDIYTDFPPVQRPAGLGAPLNGP